MELVLGFTRGDVPDYQMAAWCMAVYFKGLSGRETHSLTDAMIRSGETLDLGRALGRRVVDKHSTGGVGDKTSLAVGADRGRVRRAFRGRCRGAGSAIRAAPSTSSKRSRASGSSSTSTRSSSRCGRSASRSSGRRATCPRGQGAVRPARRDRDSRHRPAHRVVDHVEEARRGRRRDRLDVKVGDGAFMKTLEDARSLAEQMVEPRAPRGP